MGSFFTHVHLRKAGLGSAELLREVLSAVNAQLSGGGLRPAEDAEEPDRELVIAPSGPEWVAVFDSSTESQAEEPLQQLAAGLSRSLSGCAVASLVHDSDIADLRLYEHGTLLDHFLEPPDYFAERPMTQAKRKAFAGVPKKWTPALPEAPASLDELRQAFDLRPTMIEELVRQVGAVLGWDPRLATLGFNYLGDAVPREAVRLKWVRAGVRPIAVHGPPRLELGSFTPARQLSVGERLQVSTSVANVGGPHRGLRVVLSGTAVERDLIQVDLVRVSRPRGKAKSGSDFERFEGPLRRSQDGAMLEATFDAVELPTAPALDADPTDMLRSHERRRSATLYVHPEGRGAKVGEGDLLLRIEPLGETPGIDHRTRLEVKPAPSRPLGAQEGSEPLLRRMEEPAYLVGWIALAGDRQRASQSAARLFEGWAPVLDAGRSTRFSSSLVEGGARAAKRALAAKEIPAGKAWRTWREQLAGAESAVLELPLPKPASAAAQAIELLFAVAVLGQEGHRSKGGACWSAPNWFRVREEAVPHVGLWLSLAGRSAGEIEGAEAELGRLFDEAMADDGIQALVAKWDWVPKPLLGLTPYEMALGLTPFTGFHRSWCQRFLHSPAEHVWIAGSFAGARGLPVSGVVRSDVGNAVRLDAAQGENAETLSHHLSGVLPTSGAVRTESTAIAQRIDLEAMAKQARRR